MFTSRVLVLLPLLLSSSLVVAQSAAVAYTPVAGDCPPDFQLVRSAGDTKQQSLNSDEASYVQNRRTNVLPDAWKQYLKNVQATNNALPDYLVQILGGSSSTSPPTFAIASSGGGYRAAIFGAGVLNAIDGRNSTSSSIGTGGLLQAASYFSGLSGGSWLLTSLYQANFPSIQDLVFGTNPNSSTEEFGGWNTEFDIFQPGTSAATNINYVFGLLGEVKGKLQAGFAVTVTDVWARSLARHFLNGTSSGDFFSNTTHGAGISFSDLASVPAFANNQLPFPIVVANTKTPDGNNSNLIPGGFVPLSNTIYEVTPYEMGSYDPGLNSFTPTKYLGTVNGSTCITKFDQAAFIFGTSSSLFNQFNTSADALKSSAVGQVFSLFNSALPQDPAVELDVALYPNPFFGVNSDTFVDSDEPLIRLVDGGEDGQVVPFQPLLVKSRGIDVILAIDAAGGPNNFTDGDSIVTTQNRTTLFPDVYSFPPVPKDAASFQKDGLTTRPVFFGCESSSPTPLVIYIANGGPPAGLPAITNTSTNQFVYPNSLVQAMLDETFVAATQGYTGNSTSPDPAWAACLACAVVDRARVRSGTARSGICTNCFDRYCWSESVTKPNSASTLIGSGARLAGMAVSIALVSSLLL